MKKPFEQSRNQIISEGRRKKKISDSCPMSLIPSNTSINSETSFQHTLGIAIAASEPESDDFVNFFSFKEVILDQLVKGFSAFILAFGIVTAVIFFLRQVLIEAEVAGLTLNTVGNINSAFILFVAVVIIICKVWIGKNKAMLKETTTRHHPIFYLLIIIPACVLWISFVFDLHKNITHFKACFVMADIIMPASRLVFIMISLFIIHDLISYEIKPEAPVSFYLIYKSTAILTVVTCASNLVFDFVYSESHFLQVFISKHLTNPFIIYCQNSSLTKEEIKLYNTIQNLTEGFSFIFHASSIIVLCKPLSMFFHWTSNAEDDGETMPLVIDRRDNPHGQKLIPKFLSVVFPILIILFLLAFSPIILELLAEDASENSRNLNIISNSLPIPLYLLCGILDIYLLKLLYFKYRLLAKKLIPIVPIALIWISNCGIIIAILRNLLDNFYKLDNDKTLNIIQIVLQICNIVEAVLQAMMMDYLVRLKWDSPIKNFGLTRIYYCCQALIAANSGNLTANVVNQVTKGFYVPPDDFFHELIFGLLGCVCNPMILIFRAICPIILFLFINNIKASQANTGPIQ